MNGKTDPASSIRASWDGQQFHVVWTVRCALSLINPNCSLAAIAVEGLWPNEANKLSAAGEEIADLSLNYKSEVETTSPGRRDVIQFKYSHANQTEAFTASYIKETVIKFAVVFRDAKLNCTNRPITFRFVTNRPIAKSLRLAVDVLKKANPGDPFNGQALRLIQATGLSEKDALEFFRVLIVEDQSGLISDIEGEGQRRLADWTPGQDPSARFSVLSDLVRRKAGSTGDNLIRRTDLLTALGVLHPTDLLPAPNMFEPVDQVIERPDMVAKVRQHISSSDKPLILHADGGVGKTIFLQSLAQQLSERNEVALFDCFAKGAYRRADDHRHLAENGVLQIVNSLAFRGLCDPIVPGSGNASLLIRQTRRRFKQIAQGLAREAGDRCLIILLDAADNAAVFADERGEAPFTRDLIESLAMAPIDGVTLVASCRTHRVETTVGRALIKKIEIPCFDRRMSNEFLLARRSDLTETDLAGAFARSGGNPRVLSYLLETWDVQSLSKDDNSISSEELIKSSIEKATNHLVTTGARDLEVQAFLAGLALLPPPIPITAFANAIDLSEGAIRSFASDLAPMLEKTPEGLVFRDEPTESVLRDVYGRDSPASNAILDRLLERQGSVAYAAFAVPDILRTLGRSETAVSVALEGPLPTDLTSEVGRRRLRQQRLKCALYLAERANDNNSIISTLVELATLSGVNARGDTFIGKHAALVARTLDDDSRRRLFEVRAGWPGAYAARLALFHCVAGDHDEAAIHVNVLSDWIDWYYYDASEEEKRAGGPEPRDAAALALYQIIEDRTEQAIEALLYWKQHYAYRVAHELVDLIELRFGDNTEAILERFVSALRQHQRPPIGVMLAMYLRIDMSSPIARSLSRLLTQNGRSFPKSEDLHGHSQHNTYPQGLLDVAFRAMLRGDRKLARVSFNARSEPEVKAYEYHSPYGVVNLYEVLRAGMVRAWLAKRAPRPSDFFPTAFRRLKGVGALKSRDEISNYLNSRNDRVRNDPKRREYFLHDYEVSAVSGVSMLMQTHANLIWTWIEDRDTKAKWALEQAIRLWRASNVDEWRDHAIEAMSMLRYQFAKATTLTILSNTSNPGGADVQVFVDALPEISVTTDEKIEIAQVLIQKPLWRELAGKIAVKASEDIHKTEYVDDRGRQFADLATTFAGYDIASTNSFFLRGLDQLDGTGPGDYTTLYGLLFVAATGVHGGIPEHLADRLFTLCEINFVEEPHKFGWETFTKAAINCVGHSIISKLIEWHDRDKAGFEHANGSLVKWSVRKPLWSPKAGSIIFGLDSDASYYGAHAGHVLSEIVASATGADKVSIAKRFIEDLRLERKNKAGSYLWKSFSETIERDRDFAEPLDELNQQLETLADLSEAQSNEENSRRNGPTSNNISSSRRRKMEREKLKREETLNALADDLDIESTERIDQIVTQLKTAQSYGRPELEWLDLVRKRVPFESRHRHIEALLQCDTLDPSARIDAILACINEWKDSSAFIQGQRESWAKQILEERGDAIFCNEQSPNYLLSRLGELADKPISEIALEAVSFIARHSMDIDEDIGLTLSAHLNEASDGKAAQMALVRFCETLPDNPDFSPTNLDLLPTDMSLQDKWLTALVWHRLGDYDAIIRWRAARAVLRLIEYEEVEILNAICKLDTERSGSPLEQNEKSFQADNARQWLMIGLMRAAKESPHKVEPFRAWLEAQYASVENHILLKMFAARALVNLERARDNPDQTLVDKWLQTENSPFEPVARSDDHFQVIDQDPSFSFSYEFSKYEPAHLGQVFGIHATEIELLIEQEIALIDPDLTQMRERGGRVSPYAYRRFDLRDRFELYGELVVRQAMLNLATKLLVARPVLIADGDSDCRWRDWISQFDLTWDDGTLLADETDTPPSFTHGFGLTANARKLYPLAKPEEYFALHGICDSRMPSEMPIYASWRSPDKCSVDFRSALIGERGAIKACRSLSRNSFYDIWLPVHDSVYTVDEHPGPFFPFVETRNRRIGFDEWDPQASHSAALRPSLHPDIVSSQNLIPTDCARKSWLDDKGKVVLRALGWGGKYGPLTEQKDEISNLLLCDREWLMEYLKATRQKLALLITINHYQPGVAGKRAQMINSAALGLADSNGQLRYWSVQPQHRGDGVDAF